MAAAPVAWVRSYGIYLWHYPVIVLTNPAVNTNGVDPLRVTLQVALTIGLAALSYQFIEEPIRKGVRGLGSARTDAKQRRKGREAQLSRWVVSACILLVVSVGVAGKLLPVTGAAAVTVVPRDEQGAVAVTAAVAPPSNEMTAEAVMPPETVTGAVYSQAAPGQLAASAVHDGSLSAMASPPAEPTLAQGGRQDGRPSGQQSANGMQDPAREQAGAAAGSSPHVPALQGGDESAALSEAARKGAGVTAIGDSVLLDVEPYLLKLLPEAQVHAKVGRQMAEAYAIVEQLLAERKLGDTVIVELGTNGAFSKKQLDSLIDLIGDQRRILLVNTRVPRPWEDVVNTELSQTAEAHSNITLVDWFQASTNQDAFFAPDGVHLQPKGAEFYASLLAGALVPDLSSGHQLAANM
ncbi:acyltransferase family protein [Paenibacillus sp. TAB 01]|uniref:acyltransferase family protein n=1 Tax=Paenibacillus sp. TAB 01 TaxID=3368988 RepID=UPI003751AFC4